MADYETIRYALEDSVATVTLNRPDVHNAFNDVMLGELVDLFGKIRGNEGVRLVIVTGEGKSFCAGADLVWMKKVIDYTYEENLEDSRQVAECMYRLYSLPKPTIARVNGAAIGGGMGLVCACDMAIASDRAVFSLSEVKIGLVPAAISPYVVKRIGESKCREFFLTGERLPAERALAAGLLNGIFPHEDLDQGVRDLTERLLSSGPKALGTCKELLEKVPGMALNDAREYTSHVIATLRASEEGQEGMKAFLDKRTPSWRRRT